MVCTKSLFSSLLLAGSALALPALRKRITVHPSEDVIVTKANTLNSTEYRMDFHEDVAQTAGQLPLSFVNYLSDNNVFGYVTGLDSNGALVFLGPNGQYYYPTTTASTPQPIPQSAIALGVGGRGSTTNYQLPNYLTSGRLYFSVGELQFFVVSTPGGPGLVEPAAVNPNDPNAGTNYGFAEVTYSAGGGVYGDISFVDFVGLPLGLQLTTTDGSGTQQALGLVSDAVSRVCSSLQSQSNADGQPWSQECTYTSSGELIRVLAPIDLISIQSNDFNGYFNSYVQQVYQHYSTTPLTINTQAAAGDVNCYADTSSMTLSCDGDNRAYGVPTAEDVFGCNSGPFGFESGDNAVHYAVVPRLCAAFNRGTFLINGGNVQPGPPPSSYYTSSPGIYNYYSKFVHENEYNGDGYAFSYDDVSPAGGDVSGNVVSSNPGTLTVYIGGYDLA